MKWNNLRQVLALIADEVITEVKRKLREPRPLKGVRATWKKGKPSGWRYVNLKPQPKDNTGTLANSLNYQLKDNDQSVILEITGASYLPYVESGRYPYMTNVGGGKGIPPAVMDKWIGQRGLKPRDAKGKFVPINEKSMATMAFLMNRKIKWFGIEPTNIIRDTREQVEETWEQDLIAAFEDDIESALDEI